ncbi:Hypothetical_protein [Hexamita inflata]|uniref:Hypothetical_protein n=1 Tax=Hexamita inflata TaxID=28002 RepID=A0ABP1HF12_9EUKA
MDQTAAKQAGLGLVVIPVSVTEMENQTDLDLLSLPFLKTDQVLYSRQVNKGGVSIRGYVIMFSSISNLLYALNFIFSVKYIKLTQINVNRAYKQLQFQISTNIDTMYIAVRVYCYKPLLRVYIVLISIWNSQTSQCCIFA